MAQRGFSGPTLGAWGFNRMQTACLLDLAATHPRWGPNRPNIWKAWYFADISVAIQTQTINDVVGLRMSRSRVQGSM